jgi:hypothetical protein
LCISQKQDDCSAPLVSLKRTLPGDNDEFDLTNLLDADGHGPAFTYLSGLPNATYVAGARSRRRQCLLKTCSQHVANTLSDFATDISCYVF